MYHFNFISPSLCLSVSLSLCLSVSFSLSLSFSSFFLSFYLSLSLLISFSLSPSLSLFSLSFSLAYLTDVFVLVIVVKGIYYLCRYCRQCWYWQIAKQRFFVAWNWVVVIQFTQVNCPEIEINIVTIFLSRKKNNIF